MKKLLILLLLPTLVSAQKLISATPITGPGSLSALIDRVNQLEARLTLVEAGTPASVTVTAPVSVTGVDYPAGTPVFSTLSALQDAVNAVPVNNTVRKIFLMAPGNYTTTGSSVVINSRPLIEIGAAKINTVHIYNGDPNLSTFYVTGNSRHPIFTQLNLHGTINGSSPVYKSLIHTDYTTKADSLEVRFCRLDNPNANQNLISVVPFNQVVNAGIPAIAYHIHHNKVKGGGRAFLEANGHGHEKNDSTAYIVNWVVAYNDVDSIGLVDPSYGVLVSLSGRNDGCQILYNKAKDCSFAAYEVVAGRNTRIWYNTMASSMNLPGCTGISVSSAEINGQKLYNYNIDIKGGSGYARQRALALYHIRGFTVDSTSWTNEYFNEVYSCSKGTIKNSNFVHPKGGEYNPSSGNVWQFNASNQITFTGNTTLQSSTTQTNYSAVSLGVNFGGTNNISTNCVVTNNTFARMGTTADNPIHNESGTNVISPNY